MEERNRESLESESLRQQEKEQKHYTPRPKSQIVLAWILLGVVIFAILGMCYWEIFGRF
jgi:hypothetical protein